ncbi:MAG TPA: universal stress protein [Candidatus Acidoferrum sp.]|nr:universal stress protein [Candidatus Acidoferrum sp.]
MSTRNSRPSDNLVTSIAQFQRILVATDFSAGARSALDSALGIARRFQSKVYLVHVIPAGVLQYVPPESSEEAIQQARKFAAGEMKRLVENAGCVGMVQEEILCGGGVWPLLQDFVNGHTIDLLALGTHGRTDAKKQLLGPVAEEIFRLAKCSTLTVGAQSEKPSLPNGGVQRILYATNFKPHSERAGAVARALEGGQHARLTVLHVVEDNLETPPSSYGIIRDFMIQRMKKSLPAAGADSQEPDFQVRFGDPGEQILSVAREHHSDLILLGLRAAVHADGQLPSAIAYRLVCQSACPVLTIRL